MSAVTREGDTFRLVIGGNLNELLQWFLPSDGWLSISGQTLRFANEFHLASLRCLEFADHQAENGCRILSDPEGTVSIEQRKLVAPGLMSIRTHENYDETVSRSDWSHVARYTSEQLTIPIVGASGDAAMAPSSLRLNIVTRHERAGGQAVTTIEFACKNEVVSRSLAAAVQEEQLGRLQDWLLCPTIREHTENSLSEAKEFLAGCGLPSRYVEALSP